MVLDRAYQLELLNEFAKYYPEPCSAMKFEIAVEEERKYVANMLYLQEHGLIKSGICLGMSTYLFSEPTITAAGMDFLADDGGLSAILGTVTIKFHDDTLKQMIEAKILSSEADQKDKSQMISELRSLPASAIKHLTMKLLDLGLEHAPGALPLIEKVLSQFSKS